MAAHDIIEVPGSVQKLTLPVTTAEVIEFLSDYQNLDENDRATLRKLARVMAGRPASPSR